MVAVERIPPPRPVRVIIGSTNYHGQKDRLRAGWVLCQLNADFVEVYCPPRGRERVGRVHIAVTSCIMRDTAEVRAKLLAHGYDPDAKNGCADCSLHAD